LVLAKTLKHINTLRRTCEHCEEAFRPGSYARWHGDRCRKKKAG
jgi:hypothetical protein